MSVMAIFYHTEILCEIKKKKITQVKHEKFEQYLYSVPVSINQVIFLLAFREVDIFQSAYRNMKKYIVLFCSLFSVI